MSDKFEPSVRVLAPNASSKPGHLGTVRVDLERNGEPLRRVHVLFYEDGGFRIRVNQTPMVLDEAWLSGSKDHAIIGLRPADAIPEGEPFGSFAWAVDMARRGVEEPSLLADVVAAKQNPDVWLDDSLKFAAISGDIMADIIKEMG